MIHGSNASSVAVFLDGAAIARAWTRAGERSPCRLDLPRLASRLSARHGGAGAIYYVPPAASLDPTFDGAYHGALEAAGVRVEIEGTDLGALILVQHLAFGFDTAVCLTTSLASLAGRGPLGEARARGRAFRVHVVGVDRGGWPSGVLQDGGPLPPALLPNCRLRPDLARRPRELHGSAA